MSEHNEIIPEIVADMRTKYPPAPNCIHTVTGQYVHDEMTWLADRIEAAHKREVDKLNSVIQAQRSAFDAEQDRQRRAAPGNAAAMREALVLIANITDCLEASLRRDNVWDGYIQDAGNIRNIARHALALPRRQCDVGTAREQEKRHKEEACLKSACPKHEGFVSKACKGCFAMWAQMPYEAKESEAK